MIRINLLARMPSQRGVWLGSLPRPLLVGFGATTVIALALTAVMIGLRISERSAPAPQVTKSQPPSRVAYRSLPVPRRLAYEMIFTRAVFELLGRQMPEATMPPAEVHIDSFRTVRVVGTSQSKQAVVKALAGLRHEDIKLLPRPHTRVAVENGSYAYTISAHFLFALDAQYAAADSIDERLPGIAAYTNEVQRFERIAANTHVSIDKGLRFVSALKAGPYRRYVYRMDGRAKYDDMVRFIHKLDTDRVSCAFGSLHLTDTGSPRVAVRAEVYFTARE
jgi:hypothetical protein